MLWLSWLENHVHLWFPSSALPSSLLQVSTLSDLQPYMGQFVKHLQDPDAGALRNAIVVEQVLRVPTNGSHQLGAFHLYLATCLSAGM